MSDPVGDHPASRPADAAEPSSEDTSPATVAARSSWISVDWAAVIVAAVLVLLVLTGVLPKVSW